MLCPTFSTVPIDRPLPSLFYRRDLLSCWAALLGGRVLSRFIDASAPSSCSVYFRWLVHEVQLELINCSILVSAFGLVFVRLLFHICSLCSTCDLLCSRFLLSGGFSACCFWIFGLVSTHCLSLGMYGSLPTAVQRYHGSLLLLHPQSVFCDFTCLIHA